MNPTTFINVDLELSSKRDLAPLQEELRDRVFVLASGKETDYYVLNFECMSGADSPAEVIEKFVKLLESLSKESLADLKNCFKKTVDIGYESGTDGVIYNSIPADILLALNKFSLDLNISIYPTDDSLKDS